MAGRKVQQETGNFIDINNNKKNLQPLLIFNNFEWRKMVSKRVSKSNYF